MASLSQKDVLEGEGQKGEEESTKEIEERSEKVRNLENTAFPLSFPCPHLAEDRAEESILEKNNQDKI